MKKTIITHLFAAMLFAFAAAGVSSCSSEDPEQQTSVNQDESMYVDLGLSVKWARCNIDANSPEETGSYFAWGETATKSVYSEADYFDKSYTEFRNNGKKTICGTANDIATKRLGRNWRMPTKNQVEELVNNLEWSYTTINGKDVLEGIAPNGNSIIFPITGMYAGNMIQSKSQGCYWAGELYANANAGDHSKASMLSFFRGQSPHASNYYRFEGMAIRPVYVENTESSGGSASGGSSSKVEVTSVSIGAKDKQGRYTVTIKVKATNLLSGESVKTIGAKWGTVKAHPDYRDSRSGTSSATFTSAWHTGTTYYVTPFITTNKTSGEVSGKTVTKKTP